MGIFTRLIEQLPLYLLSLPVLLMAFSVHESAHGYVAYRLGDPTARNLGRITLNPIKHIDLLGFICMLVAHVGWAKPVPINTRYFKNPRRDMALTGAAGPLSNLTLALIHLILLRIAMIFITPSYVMESMEFFLAYDAGVSFKGSLAFTALSILVYLLYLGIIMNISLAIFNLIPVPPFDGSRIFYAFLPPKYYFGVMKYERIIMIVMLVLFAFGALSGPLAWIQEKILDGLFFVSGMNIGNTSGVLYSMLLYIEELLSLSF